MDPMIGTNNPEYVPTTYTAPTYAPKTRTGYEVTNFQPQTTAAPAGQGPKAPGPPQTNTSYLDPALQQVTNPNVDPVQNVRYTNLMAQLEQNMNQSLSDINRFDPIIRNQSDAYAAQAERARRNYLAETSEGLSPFATGKMRNEQRMSAAQLAQDTAGFEAELMGRELTARRSEIQHALDSMGNLLTENQRQQLQRELAAADNALQRYGIDTQSNQFYDELGQKDRQFYDELNQRDRQFGDSNKFRYDELNLRDKQFGAQNTLDYESLDQKDRQFYDDLAREYAALSQNDKQFGASSKYNYATLDETKRANDLDAAARAASTGASWGIANMQNEFQQKQAEEAARQWQEEMDWKTSDRQTYWDAIRSGLMGG